jgi:hypothetical protein
VVRYAAEWSAIPDHSAGYRTTRRAGGECF